MERFCCVVSAQCSLKCISDPDLVQLLSFHIPPSLFIHRAKFIILLGQESHPSPPRLPNKQNNNHNHIHHPPIPHITANGPRNHTPPPKSKKEAVDETLRVKKPTRLSPESMIPVPKNMVEPGRANGSMGPPPITAVSSPRAPPHPPLPPRFSPRRMSSTSTTHSTFPKSTPIPIRTFYPHRIPPTRPDFRGPNPTPSIPIINVPSMARCSHCRNSSFVSMIFCVNTLIRRMRTRLYAPSLNWDALSTIRIYSCVLLDWVWMLGHGNGN